MVIEMGFTCYNCKRYIQDNETHYCTYTPDYTANWVDYKSWLYPYVYTANHYCDNKPHCNRKDCLYHPNDRWMTDPQLCQNKSVIMDKDGKCISYVKRDEK